LLNDKNSLILLNECDGSASQHNSIQINLKNRKKIMKKFLLGCVSLCMVFAFTSCKSSESAYKKAYDKAKQQEQTQPAVAEEPAEVAPVVAPVEVSKVSSAAAGVRQEKVTVVSGNAKEYSVICGSFGLKANAENLRDYLEGQGYSPIILFNSETAMYRVAVSTFSDRASAAEARDAFKAKYPNRPDFQGAWLLYKL
jgi:cell division protein FtsN